MNLFEKDFLKIVAVWAGLALVGWAFIGAALYAIIRLATR